MVTWSLQFFALFIMLAHAVGVLDLDGVVSSTWHWVYSTRFFHGDMAEATVAAVSFLIWILFFRCLDSLAWVQQFRMVPRPLEEGLPVPIQDFLDAMAQLKGAPLKHHHWRIFRVIASFPVYLLSIRLLHMVRAGKPLPEHPPSFWRLVGELIFGLWAYDFLFYWLHLAMHRWPSLGHGHSVHHGWRGGAGADTKPSDRFLEAEVVVQHSFFDGSLQVLINILVQNLAPLGVGKHKFSRLLHNVVVTYLLTECHSGLDLPWGSHRLLPKIMGGAPRHELHHHTHRHCYHQFFTYLDSFLGCGPPASCVNRLE